MDDSFDAQGHVSVPSKQRHGAGAVEVAKQWLQATCNFGKAPPPQRNPQAGLIFFRGYEAHDCPLIIPDHGSWVCGGNFWLCMIEHFTLDASEFSDQKLPLLMAELHLSWIKRYVKHECKE